MRAVKYFLLSLLFSSPAFAQDQWANNAYSTLASGINASVTSFTVVTGEGARFPTPGNGYYLTLESGSIATPTAREIVRVTARSSDTFTVTRATQGTSGSVFAVGSRVSFRITAQSLREFGVGNQLMTRTTSVSMGSLQQSLSYGTWWWNPRPGSTTVDTTGNWSTLGTAGGVSPTDNLFSGRLAVRYTSATVAGSEGGAYGNNIRFVYRPTSSLLGGTHFAASFGVATSISTLRFFCGFVNNTNAATLMDASEPTTFTDAVGIAAYTGESNLAFITNDAAGAADTVPLGASFPARTSSADFYHFEMWWDRGPAATIWFSVRNEVTGIQVQSRVTANLPTTGQIMTPICMGSTGVGTGVAIAINYGPIVINTLQVN